MNYIVCEYCQQTGPQLPTYQHSDPLCFFKNGSRSRAETEEAMVPYRKIQKETKAVRKPISLRYDILDPRFLELLAKIADYGAKTYGDFNWQKSRLTGEKGPINHIYKHLSAYRAGEQYDHIEIGNEPYIHLAAIAFNAMMEFYYETCEKDSFD